MTFADIKEKLTWATIRDELRVMLVVTVGCIIYALGVAVFVVQYKLPDSGFTGIALLLKYAFGFPPSIILMASNAVLLAWAWRELSPWFVVRTVYAIALFSVLLEFFSRIPFPTISDMFLVVIGGGIVKGFGVGIIFRIGASSGGTDIIALALRKRYGIDAGQYNFYMALVTMLIATPLVGFERLLYGITSSYISGRTCDAVLSSFDRRRLIFLVTDKYEEITEYIVKMGRGVTLLHSSGGFTEKENKTIMCLMTARQVVELKRFVAEKYPTSFMAVTEASEVLGKGFKGWRQEDE